MCAVTTCESFDYDSKMSALCSAERDR
uniref:Uncharacterized protein n=1 Tax=Anguilla anguilla TaxID=7936 RepID=A0A0E9SY43_ANGAN